MNYQGSRINNEVKTKPTKNIKYLMCLLLTLICISILYGAFFDSSKYTPHTPDEHGFIFYSKLLAESGTLKYYDNDLINFYNQGKYINLIPRDSVVIADHLSPLQYVGIFYINTIIYLIHPDLLYYVPFLFSFFGIIGFYFIIKETCNTTAAFLGMILLATLPAYWMYSTMLFSNIIALAFFLYAILNFEKAIKYGKSKHIVIFSIFISATIYVRYEYLLGLFAMGCIAANHFIIKKNRLTINPVHILMGLFIICITGISILLMNFDLYGSYLHIGFTSTEKSTTIIPPMTFDYNRLYHNILDYIIAPYMVLLPIGFLGFIITKNKSIILNVLGLTSVFFILLFGINVFHGFNNPAIFLFSSYTRYWLVVSVTICTSATYFLSHLKRSIPNRLIIIIISILIITNVNIALTADGPKNKYEEKIRYTASVNEIINMTAIDAILLSTHEDEKLFPTRITGLLPEYNKTNAEFVYDELQNITTFQDAYFIQDSDDMAKYINFFIVKGVKFNRTQTSNYLVFKVD